MMMLMPPSRRFAINVALMNHRLPLAKTQTMLERGQKVPVIKTAEQKTSKKRRPSPSPAYGPQKKARIHK
jgi:hypothetical protein